MMYYRFWAQIRNYDPNQRVLILMGILTIKILLLIVIWRLCKKSYFLLLMKLRVIWYLLISDYYYDVRIASRQADGGRKIREQQNLFSEKNQKKYEKREQAWMKIKNREKKFGAVFVQLLFCGLLIYLVLLCLILIPRYVKIPLLGLESISQAYENIEQKALERAIAYEPFWKPEKKMEEPEQMVKSEELEQREEEAHQEIWLHLSEKGRDGSRVREEPDVNVGKIITVISGEVNVKQIGMTEDEKWVLIELENGIQGWIHNSLVEEVVE